MQSLMSVLFTRMQVLNHQLFSCVLVVLLFSCLGTLENLGNLSLLITWYSILTYLIKKLSTKCGQKQIPGGITQGQDLSFNRITVWIKPFDFFDRIIHFCFILVIQAHLKNRSKMNTLLYSNIY